LGGRKPKKGGGRSSTRVRGKIDTWGGDLSSRRKSFLYFPKSLSIFQEKGKKEESKGRGIPFSGGGKSLFARKGGKRKEGISTGKGELFLW